MIVLWLHQLVLPCVHCIVLWEYVHPPLFSAASVFYFGGIRVLSFLQSTRYCYDIVGEDSVQKHERWSYDTVSYTHLTLPTILLV